MFGEQFEPNNAMKTTILKPLTGLLLTLSVSAQAEPSNPNTDWFSQAKYGVFMHFLPGDAKGLALVKDFDVEAFAGQLEAMGAKYFVITLGQNSGYINSPNAAYGKRTGYAPGERCSTRDLPLDLYRALQPKDIRLLLHLPCVGDSWGRRNTRFSDEEWVEWARKVTAQQGVLTLDMGPNYDPARGPAGSLAEAQVNQVKAIRAALRPAADAAPPRGAKPGRAAETQRQ